MDTRFAIIFDPRLAPPEFLNALTANAFLISAQPVAVEKTGATPA